MDLAFRLLGLGQASRYDTPRIYSCFIHGNIFKALAACISGVGGGRPALLGTPRPTNRGRTLGATPFLLAT